MSALVFVLLLALAGGVGAGARFLLAGWVNRWVARRSRPGHLPPGHPPATGTLLVNLAGAFLAGLLAGAFASSGTPPDEVLLLLRSGASGAPGGGGAAVGVLELLPFLLSVGVLGAFTTFSTWMLEVRDRVGRGGFRAGGLLLLVGAAALGVSAARLGMMLASG